MDGAFCHRRIELVVLVALCQIEVVGTLPGELGRRSPLGGVTMQAGLKVAYLYEVRDEPGSVAGRHRQ